MYSCTNYKYTFIDSYLPKYALHGWHMEYFIPFWSLEDVYIQTTGKLGISKTT